MIITCKKEIPFRWIGFAILPWASFTFNSAVISVVFFFSLRKFVENPAGLTFILSLPGFVSLVSQPIVSFLSDRIWTRFGRRKPFIVTSLTGVAFGLVLFPLMPNFWALLAVYMVYNAFADLNSPMEPFKQEIIPPQERGRATGAMAWCSNLATMTFYFVALGRFDDVSYMAGFPIHGEAAIYWSAALLMLVMVMLITLGMHEVDQKSALRGERLSLKTFVGGLLDRELWPVYLLVVGSSCMNFYSGLGALSNLLYTEQWNYTKQEMGVNVAIGGIINIFAIGFLTVFADRFNRMRAYQTLICMSLSCQVLYYCYVNFVLPDKHPSLIEIIVFGEVISILSILTGLVYVPLVYDYVRRNKMGTYNAGAGVVSRLTSIITINGVGLFVWAYAVLFQPPAGEITRVVLRGDQTAQTEVLGLLHAASWTFPKDGTAAPSSMVSAIAWQANGTVASNGRCWEVRLQDSDSQKLATEKQALDAADSPLVADEQMLKDKVTILQRAGKIRDAAVVQQEAAAKETRIDAINTRIATLNDQLSDRAEKFHDEVARVLGNHIISDGDQILGATAQQALLLDLSTAQPPDARLLEKTAADLRRERADVIDLRPLKRDSGYGVAVSAILAPGSNEAIFERDLQATVERIAAKTAPRLFVPGIAPLDHSLQPALTLDLMVVEAPINTYVSPITRVVNFVLALFNDVPDPIRSLAAIARNLRVPTETNHVRVEPGLSPKTLSITVVLPPTAGQATEADDALVARLDSLLLKQGAPANMVLQARLLYDRIEKAAATQRITVARPTLTSDYAPMKYDYMSGYLWMFVMGTIGIVITMGFTRLEAKGLIRKRGIEEAQAS